MSGVDPEVAQRVARRLADVLRDELATMLAARPRSYGPASILAGFLIALRTLAASAPATGAPPSFRRLVDGAEECLAELDRTAAVDEPPRGDGL
jgi:hypothetical protein